MVIFRHYPAFPLISGLGCSAGFGPHCPLAFSHRNVLCLWFLLLWLNCQKLCSRFASFPAAFYEFPVLPFPPAVFFALPSRYKSEQFLPAPAIPLWPFSCIVPGHTSERKSVSPTCSFFSPPGAALPSSEVQPQGLCLRSQLWDVGVPLAATWPRCALLIRARLVRVASLVHESLPLVFSACQLCSSSRAVGCVAEAASLWLTNNWFWRLAAEAPFPLAEPLVAMVVCHSPGRFVVGF